MITKTQSTLITASANWQWEAALLNIWNVIHDELQWAYHAQTEIECDYAIMPVNDKNVFVQYYMKKLRAHDFNKGCFMLKLNVKDMWGVVHNTRRWAFVSKKQVLEER